MFRATMQLLVIVDEKRVEETTISTTVFSVIVSKLPLQDVSRNLLENFKVVIKTQGNLKNIEFRRTIDLHRRALDNSREKSTEQIGS